MVEDEIKVIIGASKCVGKSYEDTREFVKSQYNLTSADVENHMEKYWTDENDLGANDFVSKAFADTAAYCKEHGILSDFIFENGKEIEEMLRKEFVMDMFMGNM